MRPYAAGDRGRWDAFVGICQEATFFHRAGWERVIARGLGHRCHYLLAEREGAIEGILPLVEVRSHLFGNRLVSTPCCVYGGAVAQSEEARLALIEAAVALAQRLQVAALELRNREAACPGWPTNDLYVTFRRAVAASEEDNLRRIPRKQRAMVRKGIAAGLKASQSADVERFFRVYSESVRNLGTPVFPLRFFFALYEEFSTDTELSLVMDAGRDIAGVLSFYFRDEVLPYYGGSRPEARDLKGNDFMYWDLMARAAARGVRVFDFGRSRVGTGAYAFKRNWGFEPIPLHYQYHLVKARDLPEHNPSNPKYRFFISAWKRLPLPVANALGPLLSRHLG